MDFLPFLEQIVLSTLLGGFVGWQRERLGKAAGVRTFALVSMGSTLFTILSITGFGEATGTDPSRIAAQILTGIGFIGAGSIIHKDGGIEGITTAAGLWAIAAVGMAVGVGWYWQSIIATLFIMIILLFNKGKLRVKRCINLE